MTDRPLIDDAFGEAYSKAPWGYLNRQPLFQARRFVLDDDMSEFLAELSTACFLNKPGQEISLLESMRSLARLPHRVTWFEFNYPRFVKGIERFQPPGINQSTTSREGWLLEQHPTNETNFRATQFIRDGGIPCVCCPYSFYWSSDGPLIWGRITSEYLGAYALGVRDYNCSYLAVDSRVSPPAPVKMIQTMVSETKSSGLLRPVWAFLATINDVPTQMQEITPSRGFVAKGAYRKFLDHTVIRLTVPQKVWRRLALKAIAIARRRAHIVRGHWRKNWRHPDQNPLWIEEHQRGDASLGFVTHDYSIERGETE